MGQTVQAGPGGSTERSAGGAGGDNSRVLGGGALGCVDHRRLLWDRLFFAALLLVFLRIDDPVDAAPVHLFCGAWGVFAVGLFAWQDNVEDSYGVDTDDFGLFIGGGGRQLAVQLITIIVIIAWCSFWAGGLFLLLRLVGWLRVAPRAEIAGLDILHHGVEDPPTREELMAQAQKAANNPLESWFFRKVDEFRGVSFEMQEFDTEEPERSRGASMVGTSEL
eukprot:CAMPEP_0174269910 /NCGR_PEP_ID=MMETSP0439-20130205/42684_1 /TAXON_ID=0 /ORGANISM="Stereomyxa ramosa, Strain Chinc5" /LENGTH=220 /DNA_ID=CAMNT_0015358927 /DNA_START=56 /DNA_END=719 /DNA_ORIENTATION=-